MRDMHDNLSPVTSLDPLLRTADANGSSADLRGYEGAMVVAHVGAEGDTLSGSLYIEFEVEESDDDSAWTDVANADLLGFVAGTNTGTFAKIDAAAEAPAIYRASYIGNKRYIRIVENVTGTHTNGTSTGALIIRGLPHYAPV